MDGKVTGQRGMLNISEDVIYTIVKRSIFEIDGIELLDDALISFKKFFPGNKRKDVRIRLADDVVEIDTSVFVKNGCNVILLSEDLQQKVKSDVQNMTGITVSKVNVKIEGIISDEKK